MRMVALCLGELEIGRMSLERAEQAAVLLPCARLQADAEELRLHWRPVDDTPAGRSAEIQQVAETLRAQGRLNGWRDERYRCEMPVADPCAEFGAELFTLERAAFRFFGLMSRAVHINGVLPDGRVWCGRRALSKATDPGCLDNLAAGGLGAGEDLIACARRELWEEAGVPSALSGALRPRGTLRQTRWEPKGLHDEVLHVYELALPADFVPSNQDGEVSEFLLLGRPALRARRHEFSPDASAVMAHCFD